MYSTMPQQMEGWISSLFFLRKEKKSINAIDFKFVSSNKYCLHLLIQFFFVCQVVLRFLKNLLISKFAPTKKRKKCKSKTCSLVFKREME